MYNRKYRLFQPETHFSSVNLQFGLSVEKSLPSQAEATDIAEGLRLISR